MNSWIVLAVLAVVTVASYLLGKKDGMNVVNDQNLEKRKHDTQRLKEVADEADRDIANGDVNDRMRIFGWFRKQR